MGSPGQYGVSEYARKLIRHKARQLIGKHGFTSADREDLEQELIVDLLVRLPRFDPGKACLNTFIARIIDRKVANLVRFQRQAKRDYRREGPSLDAPIEDGEGHCIPRGETVSQDEADFGMGKYSSTASERQDMSVDVWSVILELPPELQAVARLLMTHSVSETARELGLHRDTVHRDRVARLREILEDRRLRQYL